MVGNNLRPYDECYYRSVQEKSLRSAKEIVPIVLELIKPKSVIDVGCGVGIWLSVFKEYGVNDILGVDGYPMDRKMLQIPEECFLQFNLETLFRIDRKFDLVVSLEVAEHLPPKCAETFVDSLVQLGPVILFSAAIPFQEYTRKYHKNEQWPEYWSRLFQEKGYVVIDFLRKKLWRNDNVEFCYAQNVLIFAIQDYLECNAILKKAFENTSTSQLSIVHPKLYLEYASLSPQNMTLKGVCSYLLDVLKRQFARVQTYEKTTTSS